MFVLWARHRWRGHGKALKQVGIGVNLPANFMKCVFTVWDDRVKAGKGSITESFDKLRDAPELSKSQPLLNKPVFAQQRETKKAHECSTDLDWAAYDLQARISAVQFVHQALGARFVVIRLCARSIDTMMDRCFKMHGQQYEQTNLKRVVSGQPLLYKPCLLFDGCLTNKFLQDA